MLKVKIGISINTDIVKLNNAGIGKSNQSTDSTGGPVVSECRLGKWS